MQDEHNADVRHRLSSLLWKPWSMVPKAGSKPHLLIFSLITEMDSVEACLTTFPALKLFFAPNGFSLVLIATFLEMSNA